MLEAYVDDFNGNMFQADYQLESLEEKIKRYAILGYKELSIGYEDTPIHGVITLNSKERKTLYKVVVNYSQNVNKNGGTRIKGRTCDFYVYATDEQLAIQLIEKHIQCRVHENQFVNTFDFSFSTEESDCIPKGEFCYAV